MTFARRHGVSVLSDFAPTVPDSIEICDLTLERVSHRVTRGGRIVTLTVREFELLEYLMRHYDRVVSRADLARDVWREIARVTPLDNSIDVHIFRLRRKIDLEGSVKLIHTIRGVGFVLREGERIVPTSKWSRSA